MATRSKKVIVSLVVVLLLVLFGFVFVKFYVFRKADTSVASKKADVEITVSDLVKSFEIDEKAANTKYLSKIILVKGIVDNVADTKNDTAAEITIYLKDKGKTSGVMCSFDKSIIHKDVVKSGDSVSIKGICSGYLMDVVMNKCALVK